ncbi:MAG: response regulator transcription factor [Solirubrobacteraceae bacterium]
MANRATVHLRRGRLDDADADARAASRLVERSGDEKFSRQWVDAVQAVIAAIRGDLQQSLRLASSLPNRAVEDLSSAIVCELRARIASLAGRPAEAATLLRGLGEWLNAQGIVNPAWWAWRTSLAGALTMIGVPDQAIELAEEAIELAQAVDEPGTIGTALVTRGLIVGDDAGLAIAREGLDCLAQSEQGLAQATALLAYGSELRRRGNGQAAREPLRQALDISAEGGAGAIAAAAEVELQATGARPRQPRQTGLEALTASEERIARLAAAGSTNREIARTLYISPKTVEAHLRGAYRKLSVSGRTELGGALPEA